MDYLDFDLQILPGIGRDYPVAVLRSPAGEAHVTMHFPFDQLALESRLDKLQIALLRSGGNRRSVLSDEEKAVQDLGQALFEALFTGEVRNLYDISCERAAQKERGLRLKLHIQAPELATLPWEFLYDPRQAEYVCLSRNTPLVRYLELQQPLQSLKVTPPLRILGVIASPCDLAPLDVAREKERVERAIGDLRARGLVELIWLAGQTWNDLQREMQGGPWHILHFVGHGGFDAVKDEGFVCLASEDGRTQPLYAKPLARLLADHRSLRLVMLNTCYGARSGGQDIFSSTASILLRRGIPAVLAMQDEITDRAAIAFARAFYETLARGLPADAAASEARKAVSLEIANTIEWGTPVLYMRTPDGVLFDIAASPPYLPPIPRPRRLWAAVVGVIGLLAVIICILVLLKRPTDMVRVPAGEFTMGSGAADTAALANEKPQHTVYVEEFRISRREVTNAQYAKCVKAGVCVAPQNQIYSREEFAQRPVTDVSWHDAGTYARWVGGRLPTEAEWEKACRGADARIYPWGDAVPTDKLLNYNDLTGAVTDVGSYPAGASPYGLLDMAGNVWEWTSSESLGYPYHANDGREGPDAAYRVLRGGGFYDLAENVRCVRRIHDLPGNRYKGFGFRVVASPPNTPSPTPTSTKTTGMSPPPTVTLTATPSPSPSATLTSTPSPTPTSTKTTRTSLSPTATLTATPLPPSTSRATPEPGATMSTSTAGTVMVWVWVPGGQFTMGSGDADAAATNAEKPQHQVYVDGFWISRTQVTNAQYDGCVKAGVCAAPGTEGFNRAEFANRPVTNVSWHNASQYARWVDGRLPTEAEWEKACRGTDVRIYPWGNKAPTDELANLGKPGGTVKDVGNYPKGASPYGLLDMMGNVWEWTSSLYKPYEYDATDGREDAEASGERVMRGGSFWGTVRVVRCAFRDLGPPNGRGGLGGFRVVLLSS